MQVGGLEKKDNEMNTLTLPAIQATQDGSTLLITKMRASDIAKYTVVQPYDGSKKPTDTDQGYQRPAEMPRIKKFANWLRSEQDSARKVRMPTAILLSARGSQITLSPTGTITLKESDKLPLIDGQHRSRGFQYAITEKKLTQFADYEIPVVIMLDLDKVGEMRQFSVVNGTQKSVRTDLVNMILTQLAEHEGEDSIKGSEQWKVVVSKVVAALNDDPSGPWHDQIVMPDKRTYSKEEIAANPMLRHHRVIRATSFMVSLKPIDAYLHAHQFADDESLDARTRKLRDVVDAYWRAIRDLMPDCFKRADDYVLQKTPGIFALHQFGLRVMKDMYIGRRDWTQSQFRDFLASSEELHKPEYWAVGHTEGDGNDAARYGSMKGFAELASLLYESLKDSR